MRNRNVLGLSFAKKAALAVAGLAAVAVPIAVGVLHAQPAPTPKWEVASIRPTAECGPPRGGAGKGGGGTQLNPPSPGRLTSCRTVMGFVQEAYFSFAGGHPNRQPMVTRIEGGPEWIKSDHYQVNAEAEGTPNEGMMRGPMMQALLADRFKLKIHRETREIPVYELTVAKGGPKLRSFREGSCWKPEPDAPSPAPTPEGQTRCRMPFPERKGSSVTLDGQGMSLYEFSVWFGLDRDIIDKTGIKGLFDLHLEFSPDEATPGMAPGSPDDPGRGPSIFTAVQEQLGLKIERAKGPGEFLVIDHVERPSEN
jgi:uncharacterized protein (TIGR03435 family)